MLHIILIILKTIGIILISILGILLILSLIILFVPIRYQLEAKKYEGIEGYVKIRWILSILYFKLRYEKENFIYQFRIFGFIVKDSDRPKKIKVKKKKFVKAKKTKTKKSKAVRNKKDKDIEVINNINVKQDESQVGNPNKRLGIKEDEANPKVNSENHIQNESIQRNTTQTKSIGKNSIEDDQKISYLEDRKSTLWEKLRNKIHIFFQKIKNFIDKIRNFFKMLKLKLIELNLTRESLVHRFNLVKTFLTDSSNKEGIKKIWLSIKKVVKHIIPKKVKGEVHFGTGDPCSTGEVLGVISLTYHLYQKSVKILPDFNEEILEGYLNAKGRIRLFTLAIVCIKLLLDKNFKQLLKSYQELKEEL